MTPIRPEIKNNAKCENCGKEWKTQNKPDRYCGMACRAEGRKNGQETKVPVRVVR